MDGQADGWMDGADGWMDGIIWDRRMERTDRYVVMWMDEQIDKKMNRYMNVWIERWIEIWMDG